MDMWDSVTLVRIGWVENSPSQWRRHIEINTDIQDLQTLSKMEKGFALCTVSLLCKDVSSAEHVE